MYGSHYLGLLACRRRVSELIARPDPRGTDLLTASWRCESGA
jgi:hypothetical protein